MAEDDSTAGAKLATKLASENDATKDATKRDDVALVCGASPDGETLGVLRKRGENVEAAVLRKATEGQPLHGELVRLTPRDEPMLFDVDVVYDARSQEPAPARGAGPAKVSTDKYRKGWDRLFKRTSRAPAN